jgi:hypothetical protein
MTFNVNPHVIYLILRIINQFGDEINPIFLNIFTTMHYDNITTFFSLKIIRNELSSSFINANSPPSAMSSLQYDSIIPSPQVQATPHLFVVQVYKLLQTILNNDKINCRYFIFQNILTFIYNAIVQPSITMQQSPKSQLTRSFDPTSLNALVTFLLAGFLSQYEPKLQSLINIQQSYVKQQVSPSLLAMDITKNRFGTILIDVDQIYLPLLSFAESPKSISIMDPHTLVLLLSTSKTPPTVDKKKIKVRINLLIQKL